MLSKSLAIFSLLAIHKFKFIKVFTPDACFFSDDIILATSHFEGLV